MPGPTILLGSHPWPPRQGYCAAEAAAIDFVRDAFGHLKAIAIDAGGQALLQRAGIAPDDAVVSAAEAGAFIERAKTRLWSREPNVRHVP